MEEVVLTYYGFVCRVSHGEVTESSDLLFFFFLLLSTLLKGDAAEFKPRYSNTKRNVRANLVKNCVVAQCRSK